MYIKNCLNCKREIKCGNVIPKDFCVQCRKILKTSMNCKNCGKETHIPMHKEGAYKKKGINCKECFANIARKTLKKLRDSQTPKEKSIQGKFARSKVKNSSEAVRKQWKTIKSDEDYYKKFCFDRSERAKKVWKSMDLTEKDRRVNLLLKNYRSIASNKFKNLLIENNLYDGFNSEVAVNGYVCDEVDKKRKLILEFYGDAFHCNPEKYKNPEKFLRHLNRTVQQQWNRDKLRIKMLKNWGYKVLIIWETEFKNKDLVLSKVKKFLEEN